MALTPEQQTFVETHSNAAMITVGSDGRPKPARITLGVLDGRLLSSSTEARVRTRRLRHDPRCTVFVFDDKGSWLGLETNVTIIEGDESIALNTALFRLMQGRPTGPISWFGQEMDEETFVAQLRADGRLLYEFEVERAYGLMM